jgi:hypothetical protein
MRNEARTWNPFTQRSRGSAKMNSLMYIEGLIVRRGEQTQRISRVSPSLCVVCVVCERTGLP